MLMEKNGASSNEKWLFHGSISTVINDICAQNLDWRLCGCNGTSYGKGTYFARDASYSDKYSKPDSCGKKIHVYRSGISGTIYNGKCIVCRRFESPLSLFLISYNLLCGLPRHTYLFFILEIPLFDGFFYLYLFFHKFIFDGFLFLFINFLMTPQRVLTKRGKYKINA